MCGIAANIPESFKLAHLDLNPDRCGIHGEDKGACAIANKIPEHLTHLALRFCGGDADALAIAERLHLLKSVGALRTLRLCIEAGPAIPPFVHRLARAAVAVMEAIPESVRELCLEFRMGLRYVMGFEVEHVLQLRKRLGYRLARVYKDRYLRIHTLDEHTTRYLHRLQR